MDVRRGEAEVWSCLDRVDDPELDEPVTDLGFVERVAVSTAGEVEVAFRLPTYWCSPNFAFLMAADIRREVSTLLMGRACPVQLQDHMWGEEIAEGINQGRGFAEIFGDLADGQLLEALREKFAVKAFQRPQEAVLLGLRLLGVSDADIVAMDLAAWTGPTSPGRGGAAEAALPGELGRARGWQRIRTTSGFGILRGEPHDRAALPAHLAELRGVRINMEFNGALCRGLARARYQERAPRRGADAGRLHARADAGGGEQGQLTKQARRRSPVAGHRENHVPKVMLHGCRCPARARARRPAPGSRRRADPRAQGLNAMIDRPRGHADDHARRRQHRRRGQVPNRFENMGAQVAREVSMQTNEVAGDGTTTAIVLANAMVQRGVEATDAGAKAVDLCRGIDLAVAAVVAALKASAKAAGDPRYPVGGRQHRRHRCQAGRPRGRSAHARVGGDGVITTEYGVTTETVLEVVEGMSFDRGYLSHHMVTDPEKMEAVLDNPLILMTDLKIRTPETLAGRRRIAEEEGRPLLIIAEEMAPEVVVTLLGKEGPGRYLVVHPPEYGHWRKAMLEDLAILTGGRVIARDLGGRIEDVTREDLGRPSASRRRRRTPRSSAAAAIPS